MLESGVATIRRRLVSIALDGFRGKLSLVCAQFGAVGRPEGGVRVGPRDGALPSTAGVGTSGAGNGGAVAKDASGGDVTATDAPAATDAPKAMAGVTITALEVTIRT